MIKRMVWGLLAFAVLIVATFINFPWDGFYNHYYFNHSHTNTPLQKAEYPLPETREGLNPYKPGGVRFTLLNDKRVCFDYGSFVLANPEDTKETFYYGFRNCGKTDFHVRSEQLGPLIGTIKFPLKAGESKYFSFVRPKGSRESVLKFFSFRILESDSIFERKTNQFGGALVMPE